MEKGNGHSTVEKQTTDQLAVSRQPQECRLPADHMTHELKKLLRESQHGRRGRDPR